MSRTALSVRCSTCAASVRAESNWCSLCYADLRPAPPAPSEPAVAPAAPEPVAAAHPGVSTRRGKHARRETSYDDNRTEPTAVGSVGFREADVLAERMLAELAVAESGRPFGALTASLDTKGKRIGFMVVGGFAATCVLFILMAIAGSAL